MKRVDGFAHLYSRGRTFVVRVQVPKHERARVGVREFKRSLGEGFATAKRKYPAILAELLAQIEPAVAVPTGHIPSELEIDEAVRQYHRGLRSALAQTGPEGAGAVSSRSEQVAALTEIAVLQVASENNSAMALHARWLCAEHGWNIADTSPLFFEISSKLLRARLDRLREEKHKAGALFGPRIDSDPMFSTGAGDSTAIAGQTVGQLIACFRRVQEPKLAPSTKQGYRIPLRAMEEILGTDFPLRDLSRERCRNVITILAGLPANYRKLPETRNLSLKEVVEARQQLGLPTVMPATLNGYINKLRALLQLAVTEEWISTNPAVGHAVIDPISPAQKRLPFNLEQLQNLFSGEPWLSDDRDVGGRPARFWLPLLALYSGARVGELAQLAVADIGNDSGVEVINIRPTNVTRLKNPNAERSVPIHPELVRLGFLNFVQKAKGAEQARLFPQERSDRLGHHGRGVSDWFARLCDKRGIVDPKITFHSFRHNFEDALREAGLHGTPIALYLTGRSGGGVSASYGRGYSKSALLAAITLVNYPGLNLAWLYNQSQSHPI